MKSDLNIELLDQPIPDARSKEFKKTIREIEGNMSQKQKEGVNFGSRQAEAIDLINTLSQKLSRREIASKIGYSKAYVIAILKGRFWPKKLAKQQEILRKLREVKSGVPPNLNRDKNKGKI